MGWLPVSVSPAGNKVQGVRQGFCREMNKAIGSSEVMTGAASNIPIDYRVPIFGRSLIARRGVSS